ncbi:hypothetical protein JYU34_019520 [Plutella xylostella]|uniref:Uncharacterized protein n=1 Tax=Plutella xylostella TaxID=51655 RepID=A0ABQ7PX05_PLUXY|nr:hypothetical protein JYU34_019520 [Plutella xylostella]
MPTSTVKLIHVNTCGVPPMITGGRMPASCASVGHAQAHHVTDVGGAAAAARGAGRRQGGAKMQVGRSTPAPRPRSLSRSFPEIKL